MKKSVLKVLIYGAIVTPFAVGFYAANYTQKGCQLRSGIWNSVATYCIPKDCREKEICGSRHNPREHCEKVKRGDNIDQAYFWLGEPTKIMDNHYFWQAVSDKTVKHHVVTATIEKQKIIQLRCK